MVGIDKNNSKWWVIVGDKENWGYAIQGTKGIWGVRDNLLKKRWDKLSKGDYVLFYVKSPIKGIVGYGRVEAKNKQDKPLWPDEVKENKVIYPWRFYFDIIYILPLESWEKEKLQIKSIPILAGLGHVSKSETIEKVTEIISNKWIEKIDFDFPITKPERGSLSLHDQIKELLYKIGREESFISEKEVQLNGERLDVGWRRVVRGVPVKVFEVQISGNIHQALAKLKHSYDMWNSEPYIIIEESSRKKVEELMSGTFHEIKDKLTIITTNQVEDFYSILRRSTEARAKLGL